MRAQWLDKSISMIVLFYSGGLQVVCLFDNTQIQIVSFNRLIIEIDKGDTKVCLFEQIVYCAVCMVRIKIYVGEKRSQDLHRVNKMYIG